MTPQEMIDLPSAGMAAKQLKKQKDWDADAGKEYKKWRVTIEGYVTETELIIVKARSEEEAHEKADQKGDNYFDQYNGCLNAKELT